PEPLDSNGWKFGIVVRWDQGRWCGTVKTAGPGGEELPIAPGAVRKAGLTNLFGGQRVEFRVVVGPGGQCEADDLKLVVQSGRAATVPHPGGIRDNFAYKRYFGLPQ